MLRHGLGQRTGQVDTQVMELVILIKMFIGVTPQMGEQHMGVPLNMDPPVPRAHVLQEFWIAHQRQALICKSLELKVL